ncbi:hypothetical protein PENPOL_c001G05013 [Penicillium polonicum]|uniref:Uncharacterized protein n=1 Tax=Penicillium polonicum TaxID=60169 RepID=A0A1V6P5G3_PENPO|nr:hypothetical protein PENPOL_c001G05013 [Penicillium polonicum]
MSYEPLEALFNLPRRQLHPPSAPPSTPPSPSSPSTSPAGPPPQRPTDGVTYLHTNTYKQTLSIYPNRRLLAQSSHLTKQQTNLSFDIPPTIGQSATYTLTQIPLLISGLTAFVLLPANHPSTFSSAYSPTSSSPRIDASLVIPTSLPIQSFTTQTQFIHKPGNASAKPKHFYTFHQRKTAYTSGECFRNPANNPADANANTNTNAAKSANVVNTPAPTSNPIVRFNNLFNN